MAASNSYKDVKSSQHYQAVQNYLSGHVASLVKAQDKFCEPVEDKYMTGQNSEDVEELLWSAWKSVIEAAKTTADDTQKRQKLVDFVLSLHKRPALEKSGNVCKVWDATVWSDLPVFGAQLRECWNASASDSSSSGEQQQWLNINAFTAAVVSSSHSSGDKPDFSLYAVWALREAFEEEKPSSIAIEAAATWLVCSSQALADMSKAYKSFEGKLARPGSLYQDKQWTGFNSDRWQSWMSKLNEVHADELDARGKDLVNKAKQKVSGLK